MKDYYRRKPIETAVLTPADKTKSFVLADKATSSVLTPANQKYMDNLRKLLMI